MFPSADELKLVHPDHHETLQMVSSSGNDIQKSTIASHDTYHLHRMVDVIFHTYKDRKLVRMELTPHDAYEQIFRKAQELLPTATWRIFSGDENHVDAEFTNSRQVWDAIKHGIYYHFDYLHVRQIKNGETARCDACYREIYGNRYKCTTCSDFDLCGACEARGMHPFHQLLKI